MGGGFGAKTSAGAHTFVAALLARRTGRPVRCVNDREGEQSDTGNRPSTEQRVTLGARRDGRLTLIECEADVPLGIGGWEGGPAGIFQELYSCPNVRTVERFAYVNTSPMTAFRAPGHVEGAFALESAMDALARELGIDPLELRRINFAARDREEESCVLRATVCSSATIAARRVSAGTPLASPTVAFVAARAWRRRCGAPAAGRRRTRS